MDNNTDEKNKRLTDMDTATMWLGDARVWIEVAENLDRESRHEQDDNPVNQHKLAVTHSCTGLAFELVYKSLLMAEIKQPIENHRIEKLHGALNAETQGQVEEWIKEAGWKESGELLKYLDEYMAPPGRKNWIESPWKKEKRESGVTTTGMGKIPDLAVILRKLTKLGERNLERARDLIRQNQTEPQNDQDVVFDKFQEIAMKSANGDYIYRGEPECYEKVSSNLYRQYEDDIEPEDFEIDFVQTEMLKEAKGYVYEDSEFEILAQLQHYGGKTNLIDFTADYLIALFFACDGGPNVPGRVILLDEKAQRENRVEKPRNTIDRARDQKSIFVQPPKGYIDPSDVVVIPEYFKQPILDHLRQYHDISTNTMYNDLHGFIKNRERHQRAYTEFFSGLMYHDREDYEKTIKHYTQALELNPLQADAYHYRGKAYLNRGLAHLYRDAYDHAIEDFNKATELDPDSIKGYYYASETHHIRGTYRYAEGEDDLAIEDYTKTIQLQPDYADAYFDRGVAYYGIGKIDAAIRDYSKVLELSPKNAMTYFCRGNAYHIKGDSEVAIKDYNIAIELKPDFAEAYNQRGFSHVEAGNYDCGIKDHSVAIGIRPDYTEAYFDRARAYKSKADACNDRDDYCRAIKDFSKAIELNPDFSAAYNHRGVAYLNKGDYDNAITDFTKAIDPKTDFVAEVYYNRGLAYFKKDEDDEALKDFTKAIGFHPEFVREVCYNRGRIWLSREEWKKAKSDLMTAKDKGMDIAATFHEDYGSVPEFEQKHGVHLPKDITALLTP